MNYLISAILTLLYLIIALYFISRHVAVSNLKNLLWVARMRGRNSIDDIYEPRGYAKSPTGHASQCGTNIIYFRDENGEIRIKEVRSVSAPNPDLILMR